MCPDNPLVFEDLKEEESVIPESMVIVPSDTSMVPNRKGPQNVNFEKGKERLLSKGKNSGKTKSQWEREDPDRPFFTIRYVVILEVIRDLTSYKE